ncbi:MAG TPA: hypothetical protein VFV20_01770 [Candidatus Limnocylindria bacterium]|nr:hypothetical protein [Candidatus Limnocylindria bacterium]
MARRHRTRTRTRRTPEVGRGSVVPARAEREEARAPRPSTHRPSRGSRTGYARAVGAPSQALERAAVMERGFVLKDFRRLGLVVAVALALLIVAGFLESVLIK